ncbi:hypothetical protein DRO59_07815 [Candidatus Bathyarchaeota archaeon]|nr:MAG: hypothetical protein DRO59_07815 [Candidatus Bathyarchaeota archaeon]
MVKVSVNRFVSRRVEKVRREVEVSAQRLRKKTLKHLEEIFATAARVARGEGGFASQKKPQKPSKPSQTT